ncbi:50S ribosomal protein L3 [bacterium]|nr:50S ribosomal protein L3 [candidate division CSSED10-310 bacterium]
MALGIIGKKIGMTQLFDARGHLVPVTVIQAGPCPVIQKKTVDNDGYNAIQIGFGESGRKKSANKPYSGHFKAARVKPAATLQEIKVENIEEYEVGQNVKVDIFKPQDTVVVTGFTKGKGFAGVIKRHGFAGKDSGHGTHEAFRHGGSIGTRVPKRTLKGRRMPGRMGNKQFTVKNLQIMLVDKENNLLMVKGAVPGWKGGYLVIRKAQ